MGFLSYYYYDVWNELGDPRVTDLALLDGGPWATILLVALYVYISKYAGPSFMQSRKPFDLKQIIFVHNVFLVVLNSYMFYHGMILSNYGLDAWACKLPDRFDTSPIELWKIKLGWLYFISKFIDFLDTFFFVLRKKGRQLSFLHLYHHAAMPLFSWLFLKFIPSSNSAFVPLVNAFVHIVMYLYYALSTFPSLRPYLWWKKYLTAMQLVQFVMIIVHSIYSMLKPQCEWPKIFIYIALVNAALFFRMFYSFFRATYSKPKPVSSNSEKLDEKSVN